MSKTRKFMGITCTVAKPTKGHRAALWENMLGTVWAVNDAGEVKFFDYDLRGARAFAGVKESRDPRVSRHPYPGQRVHNGPDYAQPTNKQLILWIKR